MNNYVKWFSVPLIAGVLTMMLNAEKTILPKDYSSRQDAIYNRLENMHGNVRRHVAETSTGIPVEFYSVVVGDDVVAYDSRGRRTAQLPRKEFDYVLYFQGSR